MESIIPNSSSHALPEKIDTSSGSQSTSDVDDMSEVSEDDQGEDVDISFASSCEPVSPETSQEGTIQHFTSIPI